MDSISQKEGWKDIDKLWRHNGNVHVFEDSEVNEWDDLEQEYTVL
jgi:hypothetical protein